jgi:hypothetical protein
MVLLGIERRLEALVEGAFARVFKSQLRPVELGRRMIRELDANITIGVRGERVAPNHVALTLAQDDYERFSMFGDALAAELADAIEEHATAQNFVLMGPAMVDLLVSPKQRAGQFKVTTAVKSAPRAAAARGWLEIPDGSAVAVLDHDIVSIGRLPECEITVPDSNVSRRHAEVRVIDGSVAVVDLKSLNGTKVNGRGVPADDYGTPLSEGDVITVGPMAIRYTRSRTRSAQPAPVKPVVKPAAKPGVGS